MTVRRIIYVSTASDVFDDTVLFDILNRAESNNRAEGITGLLMYGGECFMQVLEGESGSVGTMLQRISKDPRHHDIVLVEDVEAERRLFGEWSMAYVREDNMRPADRKSFRELQETILADAGMGKGDPGIINFLTRAFLNAVASGKERRQKMLQDTTEGS